MAAASGSSRRRPWPYLPSELLGLVLARLPSHADRVRLSAVCPAWRSSARLQHPLPPTLPWLSLRDGSFLSLPDGAVHRLPIPGNVLCRVSTGSTLFLVHAGGSRSLMSHSSSATTRAVVPQIDFETRSFDKEHARNIRKAVVSKHRAAVLNKSKTARFEDIMSTRRRKGRRTRRTKYKYLTVGWSLQANKFVAAIAIFQGDLYLLTTGQELLVLNDRGRREMDKWGIRGIPRDGNEDVLVEKNYYLVVSGDQLLMVKQLISLPPTLPRNKPTCRFEVFEATSLRGGSGRWTKVDNLMGRALFVSEGCSESLPIAGSNIGVQEDCIYFVTEGNSTYSHKKIHDSLFPDSGVYNMREQTMTPLPFEMVRAAHKGPWSSTWFFPQT